MSTILATFDLPLFIKGALTVIMAFVIFVGSIYVLLGAVFGWRMGYLVLAVCFFGWMIILSAIWAVGFKSQGPETPINLGPRFTESHWEPVGAAFVIKEDTTPYPEAASYPGGPWHEPTEDEEAEADPAATAMKTFLAEQTNEQYGIEPIEHVPVHAGGSLEEAAAEQQERLAEEGQQIFEPENFTVQEVRFTTAEDGTKLVAAKAFYEGGGPSYTAVAYFDKGMVGMYSWLFLAVSIIGLLVHLPFLDKAEAKRKEILTGGTAPVWRGPA